MFEGLSEISHGKLSLILRECLFSLQLITLFINKIEYPFPKSMSLIKFSSAVMWESERMCRARSTRDIKTAFLTCGRWFDLKCKYLLFCVVFL
jgi:hypothetical protein